MAALWRDQSFSSPIDFSPSPSSPRHTPNKTADIGQDGVSLSADPQGRILQLSTFHAGHGIVVAVPFEQFDGSKYYDPKFVRSYRTRMLQYMKEGKGGFGLDVAENAYPGSAQIVSRSLASFIYTVHTPHGNLEVSYTTRVLKGGEAVQTAAVKNPNPIQITHGYALKLCLSLNRASYGQLTEGGPIPLPPSRNSLCRTAESVFNITNPYLGARLEGSVEVDGTAISLGTLKPGSASEYAEQISYVAKGHLGWVFNRAERPRSSGEVYREDYVPSPQEPRGLSENEYSLTPMYSGFWHRSYLVTGKPKDQTIFQLDQQCYPLLELCDYLDCFPHDVDFVMRLANSGVIAEILEVLASKRDAETGLWPTDETPGDDAVTLPHHFSSHILLWRTYTRLRELWASIKPMDEAEIRKLSDMATEIRDKTLRSFTTHHPQNEKSMFAYFTNGHGEHRFYHDANDVPTLFAAEWEFVETLDQIKTWRNTMDFGLSPLNERGFCAEGSYRGLGSQHSPGAWVLGYFQELAYAASVGDAPAIDEAWEKILASMQWDGTFPEAVDPQTAKCSSKAWFSWPGSMIGALLIRMRVNGKDQYLER
ncbi:hypothetical protein DL768_003201 [Monosporascus sp. mg162]|nr:hypothetical protein DL768_003201 [Monosporascus sp. mg162]